MLAAVVALGVHLAFLLLSTSPRQSRVTLAAPRDEMDVRLQDEALPAPGAPGGHSGSSEEDVEEPKPVAPRRPVAVKARPAPAKPVSREVVSVPDRDDSERDRVAAPVGQPTPDAPPVATQAPTPQPIPSNSRDPNWRRAMQMSMGMGRGTGEGSGRGGLFGNGRVAGDGPGALEVRVCFISPGTRFVRDVHQCDAIQQQFIDEINIPARRFEDGFPGFEDRTEWFAVMIQGAFTVPEGGVYQFRLKADDGALLFIDGELVVDNDGIHGAISKRGSVELREGRHRMLLRYFQGMKYELALQLFVTPPGQAERLFRSAL
jgi:PA14 domain